MENSLVVLTEVERRLASIKTVDEAKKIRDQAEAIRIYAKKIRAGLNVQNRAAAVKLLAEHRAGELLAKTSRGRPTTKTFQRKRFLPNGVTFTQSHRWQAIATVSKAEINKREIEHTEKQRELTSQEIYRLAIGQRRDEENKRTLDRQVALKAESLGIHHGDFRTLAPAVLPDESVHLVLTDPPYDEESIELYKDAAREAARVLVPGGSFIAYAGHKHLAQTLVACAAHLTYWWLFALVHDGSGQLLQRLGVRCRWKPILWFVKKTRGNVAAIIPDIVQGAGREKDAHEWQQAEGEAVTLIERFTQPNDLVVDFMAGSGTIPAAAKRLDRRLVAFELLAENVAKIVQRIA